MGSTKAGTTIVPMSQEMSAAKDKHDEMLRKCGSIPLFSSTLVYTPRSLTLTNS